MASADTSPPRIKSPPDSGNAPPIGAGSVETSEMDCEISREDVSPKQYAGPHPAAFPQRVLPPFLPPSITPSHDAIVKTPSVANPVEAQPNHRFIFHEEPTRAWNGQSALPADRPAKRKRCSGLSKTDKLALITICTRHKADYKQGDKTGFWDLVKKSMLAETGKDLAQPRSMVERWCNWEIDQILERQTTHDQQDFRFAVKKFCARWKEVRQEYNTRRQSKANPAEDTSQARAGEPKGISGVSPHGISDDPNSRRFRSVLGKVKNSEYDIATARPQSVDNLVNHVHKDGASGSHTSPNDVPLINNHGVGASAGNTTGGSSIVNGKALDLSSASDSFNSHDPIRRALKSGITDDNASSGTVPEGNVPKGNILTQNGVTGNTRPYYSPYRWAQYRVGPDSSESASTTTGSNVPYHNKVELASASLPTPRASISGSQSSASSPITSMDFRQFPHIRADNTRNPFTSTPQSSNRVTSSPIDDLAQAYVTRTYEASFDILRDIMTKHDEVVRQLSTSKSLLVAELEASKRHSDKIERELQEHRHPMDVDKSALKAQLEKSEAQNVASQQLMDSLQRQKTDALMKFQDSYELSQQLQLENASLRKQLDESKRPSAEATGGVGASEPLVETTFKRSAVAKDLETGQRQVVRIKNEKSVLELEISVLKRQIQELKAHIPYPTERPPIPTTT